MRRKKTDLIFSSPISDFEIYENIFIHDINSFIAIFTLSRFATLLAAFCFACSDRVSVYDRSWFYAKSRARF